MSFVRPDPAAGDARGDMSAAHHRATARIDHVGHAPRPAATPAQAGRLASTSWAGAWTPTRSPQRPVDARPRSAPSDALLAGHALELQRAGGGRAVRPQPVREAWSTGAEVAGAPVADAPSATGPFCILLAGRRLALLEYARTHDSHIDDFIEATAFGQGIREARAARRADQRPPARRPPGRQRTLAATSLSELARSEPPPCWLPELLALPGGARQGGFEHL